MIGATLTAAVAIALHVTSPADSVSQRPLIAVFVQGAFEFGPLTAGEAPLFVLYEDGTVIYCVQRVGGGAGGQVLEFATVRLSAEELSSLRNALALDVRFFSLRDVYRNTPDVTDMPHYIIWAWRDSIAKRVSVYGSVDTTSWIVQRSMRERGDTVPKAFIELCEEICAFRHRSAQPWHPSAYQLMLQNSSNAREAPMPWPSGWPTTVRSDATGGRYVMLTPKEFDTFRREYAAQISTRPFVLGGEQWFAFGRIVFPGEDWWIRAANWPPN